MRKRSAIPLQHSGTPAADVLTVGQPTPEAFALLAAGLEQFLQNKSI